MKTIYVRNRTILHLGGKNKTTPPPPRNVGKEQSSKVGCCVQLQGRESRGCIFFLIWSRCVTLIHGRCNHSQTLVYDTKWQKSVPLTAATHTHTPWGGKALAALADLGLPGRTVLLPLAPDLALAEEAFWNFPFQEQSFQRGWEAASGLSNPWSLFVRLP